MDIKDELVGAWRNRGMYKLSAFGILILLAAMCGVLAGLLALGNELFWLSFGETATGSIERSSPRVDEHNRRQVKGFSITFTYETDSGPVHGTTVDVPLGWPHSLEPGAPVEVRHIPGWDGWATLQSDRDWGGFAVLFGTSILIVAGAFAGFNLWYRAQAGDSPDEPLDLSRTRMGNDRYAGK